MFGKVRIHLPFGVPKNLLQPGAVLKTSIHNPTHTYLTSPHQWRSGSQHVRYPSVARVTLNRSESPGRLQGADCFGDGPNPAASFSVFAVAIDELAKVCEKWLFKKRTFRYLYVDTEPFTGLPPAAA
jgi:hypothetical protein